MKLVTSQLPRVVVICLAWTASVWTVEVVSTRLVAIYGGFLLLFVKHAVGASAAWVVGNHLQATRMPVCFWLRQVLAAPMSLPSTLFLGTASSNLAAIVALYYGYLLGGLDGAYAFKSTEPLMTCILSTTFVQQRVLHRLFPSDGLLLHVPAPGWREWLSVAIVCAGAICCSVSLMPPSPSLSSSAEPTPFWSFVASVGLRTTWTSALILGSNFFYGLRTLLQKALFAESHVSRFVESEFVMRLFLDVGIFGAVVLALPAAVQSYDLFVRHAEILPAPLSSSSSSSLGQRPPMPPSSLLFPSSPTAAFLVTEGASFLIAGLGTMMIQALNSVVLLRLSCLGYAIAKQVRALFLFGVSILYVGSTVHSPMAAAAGAVLVLCGSAAFVTAREGRLHEAGVSHSTPTMVRGDDGLR